MLPNIATSSLQPAQKTYEHLRSGQVRLKDINISRLFNVASELAVAGDYDAKKHIYAELILKHPNVTAIDVFRVQTYQFDLIRRDGKAGIALTHLEELTAVDDPAAQAEYLQAVGQCYISLFHESGDPKELTAALNTQQKIFVLEGSPLFPTDKQLYYLETLIYFEIESFRVSPPEERELQGSRIDDHFEHYRSLLTEDRLMTPAHRIRAEAILSLYEGNYFKYSGEFAKALRPFELTMRLFSDEGGRAIGALNYLYCRLKETSGHLDPEEPAIYSAKTIYQQFCEKLQVTEIPRYRSEIDLVEGFLSSKPM